VLCEQKYKPSFLIQNVDSRAGLEMKSRGREGKNRVFGAESTIWGEIGHLVKTATFARERWKCLCYKDLKKNIIVEWWGIKSSGIGWF
jgi:hypothetical protein